MTEIELAHMRYNAFVQAVEINPKRFTLDEKPTTEELLVEAQKIVSFIVGEEKPGY
jgi:hypothetical protein